MKDRLLIALLSILPNKLISRLAGSFAKSTFSKVFIPHYASFFKINTEHAEKPIYEYQNLVDFFIRRLKPGLRPLAEGENNIICPVDGCVSVFGEIKEGQLIQAKGVTYSVENLLGGDKKRAQKYQHGSFITIYLSPRDYHRIHVPLAGEVNECVYVPGTLFPVNTLGVRAVKGLFAKNERLITYLNSIAGELAIIKVGATIVGSVKVVFDSSLGTNIKNATVLRKEIKNVKLQKGDEIGYFEFGSTVILLFEPSTMKFSDKLKPGDYVQMGQKIGEIVV